MERKPLHRPVGCNYPDCLHCNLQDCEYNEDALRKDKQAADMRRRRRAKPEQYREAQRAYKARVRAKDPDHFARLAREYRKRKKLPMQLTLCMVAGHTRHYKSGKTKYIEPHQRLAWRNTKDEDWGI